MKNIRIDIKDNEFYKPVVDFNYKTGVCSIEGESFLEETDDFYTPLIEWLKQYIEEITKTITFNIKLTYYNTSSSKKILTILRVLKRYVQQGGNVIINWYYEKNDNDTIEDAEDFMIITGLKFNLVMSETKM